MPRPIRIEYENAFYHVMNRGRARNNIFHNENHYLIFLKVIEESCKRFGIVIHAYCLMPNHYHLLIQTPKANLSRSMRHINSVYTQRFNKIQKIDGPLFRGRYKAILVDEDSYLIGLSRYIHRNPIEIKSKDRSLLGDLKDYKWSSYPFYLNLLQSPNWLNKDQTLSIFGGYGSDLRQYKLFVEGESDGYNKRKENKTILGDADFKKEVFAKMSHDPLKQERIQKEVNNDIPIEKIIAEVANFFNVSQELIINKQKGRPRSNPARNLAMYLIQEYKDYSLKEIAKLFNLKSDKSSAYALSKAKKDLDVDICDYVKRRLFFYT